VAQKRWLSPISYFPWKEYGKSFSDRWEIKLLKAIFTEVFRPEEKPVPDRDGSSHD